MAIYFDSVGENKCPLNPDPTTGSEKDKINFFIDSVADIASLPGIDRIRGGSSAFILPKISGKRLYFLGENGWV